MNNALKKNIYILDLNGYWDDKDNCARGGGPFDYTIEWHGNDIVHIPSQKPVKLAVPQRYHLKKNTGKRNSIERPFVYTYPYHSTMQQVERYNKKFEALMADLNAIDMSKAGHMTDNAEAYYRLIIPADKYAEIKNILKKHGIENVYTQVRGTKHYSSYTPEDLEKSFDKLN